jgi:hypothetical protein
MDQFRNPTVGSARGPLRPHKSFGANAGAPGQLFRKFPGGVGVSDDNVVFGLGTSTSAAAGPTTFVLTGNVSRQMVLRDLVIALGAVRGRVTQISAAGDALLQGGSVPVEMFAITNTNRPPFDIPVYTGTVQITVTADAAYTCDAGFNID